MFIPDYKSYPRASKTLRIDPHNNYALSPKQMKQGYCAYCLSHACPDNDVAKNKGLKKQKSFHKKTMREMNIRFWDYCIV